MLFEKSFRYSEKPIFRLASGRVSSYYIDCKKVTLDPHGAYLVGRLVFDRIKELGADGIGGLTLGADPIAQAVSIISHINRQPVPAFIVRKEPKGHGLSSGGWIEGNLQKSSRVVVVDDVVTTAGSTLKAIDRIRAYGCRILMVVAIVDRGEGGRRAIRSRGLTFDPLFTMKDLLGLLPKKR